MLPRLMVGLLMAVFLVRPEARAVQNDPAATNITAEAVRRHVAVIAHDSMQGRATPSRGLTLTARYVADQFLQAGLNRHSGNDDGWFQHYPLPTGLHLDPAATSLGLIAILSHQGKPVVSEDGSQALLRLFNLDLKTDAWIVGDSVPQSGAPKGHKGTMQSPVLLAGPHTVASVQEANLRGGLVVYLSSPATDTTTRSQIVTLLRRNNNVLILNPEDSATFARRRAAAVRRPVTVVPRSLERALNVHGWAAEVWPPAAALFLRSAGVDLAEAWAAATPVVREVPAKFGLRPAARATVPDSGMNVIGVLRGRDQDQLRDQYLVVLAHMDHAGAPGQADSAHAGADDNASGVAGLLALAAAFGQLEERPRRSIIFAGVSGSARGFWGSYACAPLLGMQGLVAGINLDMIGREAGDSLRVDGLGDIEVAPKPEWIAGQHTELGITLVDGGSAVHDESDHVAFVQHGIPMLYFANGRHSDPPLVDTPAGIDAEQEARMLRMIFHITRALADAEEPPRWSPAGRRRWVGLAGD